jgi:hypothetical protein
VYRVTDTAAQGLNATLNDISVLPDGRVRLVWITDDEGGGIHNVYATTFPVASPVPTFSVCLLYDPTRVVRSGSTLAIKIQLRDGNGVNQSSPSIVVTAVEVQKLSTDTPPTAAVDTLRIPTRTSNFRFDPTLGGHRRVRLQFEYSRTRLGHVCVVVHCDWRLNPLRGPVFLRRGECS